MSKVALFGAVGAIGRSIASALSSNGEPYRVVGRNEASLRKTFSADRLAEIVSWDPDSPDSVKRAATGIETLIYLVGVNYWQFELHPELMRKTLDGAISAGVKNELPLNFRTLPLNGIMQQGGERWEDEHSARSSSLRRFERFASGVCRLPRSQESSTSTRICFANG